MKRKPRNGLRYNEKLLVDGEGNGVAPGPSGYVTVPLRIYLRGRFPMLRLLFSDDAEIRVAPYHELLTPAGWIPAERACEGVAVAFFSPLAPQAPCSLEPGPPHLVGQGGQVATIAPDPSYLKFLSQPGFYLRRILAIEEEEEALAVYLYSPESTLLLASGGLVVHV